MSRFPHDTGIYPPRTHLFLDGFYVRDMNGVERSLFTPVPIGEGPVLEPEMPWEGVGLIGRNGIFYDQEEELFKCWYPCHDPALPDTAVKSKRRWAYAASADGVNWERPVLGLSEFEGSTDNNLIRFENMDEVVGLLWTVVKDPREADPAKRYKAIGLDRHGGRPGEITWTGPDGEDEWYERTGAHIGCGLFIGYSADGLTWRLKEGWAGSGALIMDGSILHGYDERIRQWVLWQRPRILPKYRAIGVSFSPDFEDWSFPEFGLVPDAQDPEKAQFDALGSIASPDGGYIGILGVAGFVLEDFGVGGVVPQLVYSRDAKVWTRVSREPFMRPAGDPPRWDDGCMIAFNPMQVGHEIFLFYYGKNAGHIWGDPTYDGKRITRSGIGLQKLPRDRWVGIAPSRAGEKGTLLTTLISVGHNELHINANAEGGAIRVDVIDYQTGEPVPGYSATECDPITADSLDHTVTWNGSADLCPIIGTARRQPRVGRGLAFRFALKDATLYGFSC